MDRTLIYGWIGLLVLVVIPLGFYFRIKTIDNTNLKGASGLWKLLNPFYLFPPIKKVGKKERKLLYLFLGVVCIWMVFPFILILIK